MPRKTTSPAPKVFTDAFLKKLAVPRDKKDIVLFDDGTGLGVRKTDRGVISFLIQIRLRDGRRWRETFKTSWPTLTIAAARDALKVRAAGLALGVDPFEEREAATAEREASREAAAKAKAEADEFTLRVLMRRWDHYALAHRRASCAVRALRAIELTFPKMIDKPVAEIDRKTVRAAVDAALD